MGPAVTLAACIPSDRLPTLRRFCREARTLGLASHRFEDFRKRTGEPRPFVPSGDLGIARRQGPAILQGDDGARHRIDVPRGARHRVACRSEDVAHVAVRHRGEDAGAP